MSNIDVNCLEYWRKTGSKQSSKTNGGISVVCTSCHIHV